jgi:hypothetical protein
MSHTLELTDERVQTFTFAVDERGQMRTCDWD